MEVGSVAPSFCLKNENGEEVCLEDYLGRWVVLYFYPKDNTPGCTKEAQNFSENLQKFRSLNADILGVSPDSVESHKKFKEKHDLKITLLSDQEKKVLQEYSVWRLKKRYGKEFYGVVRSTFLIDPHGNIRYIWNNVRVKGHVEKVFNILKDMIKEK